MCDSTNLNLSPLCDVTAANTESQATLWGQAASDTYHSLGLKPDYVENIVGPTRQFYINQDRRDRELLSSIVEVSQESCPPHSPLTSIFSLQTRSVGYNAFERDISILNIYFGDSTVMGLTT